MSPLMRMVVLLFAVVVLLAGCREEDSISITGDGVVTFQSMVTMDEHETISFANLDKISSDFVAELQEAKWKVERKWISEKPPYALQFSGSGDLHEVAASTKLYTLKPVLTGFYRVSFLTPQSAGGGRTARRIVFTSGSGAPNAEVHDAAGRLVSKIDRVSGGEVYTIRLRPVPRSQGAEGSAR